jgi:inosine-uridine nucleoside N-ribohydrolase
LEEILFGQIKENTLKILGNMADLVRDVVIDTDPGIDDAMALFMALEAHRKGLVNIVAFTLVAGNCSLENTVKNMTRILSFYPSCSMVIELW